MMVLLELMETIQMKYQLSELQKEIITDEMIKTNTFLEIFEALESCPEHLEGEHYILIDQVIEVSFDDDSSYTIYLDENKEIIEIRKEASHD